MSRLIVSKQLCYWDDPHHVIQARDDRTPHLGYCKNEQCESIYGGAVSRLLAYADTQPLELINPEGLQKAKA
jgi:hypothetical protein